MTILDLANQYQVDTNKPFFPVNTIRIFYLILLNTLSDNPQQSSQTLLDLLPKISAVLDARSADNAASETPPQPPSENQAQSIPPAAPTVTQSPLPAGQTPPQPPSPPITAGWQAGQPAFQDLATSLGTPPTLQPAFEQLYGILFPLQSDLLLYTFSGLSGPDAKPTLESVQQVLTLRSMDSLAYSSVVCALINKPEHNAAIHYLINLVYQINDLVDCVVHAKEDIESENFSPFEILRQVHPDATNARQAIMKILDTLIAKKDQVALPEPTMGLINEFCELMKQALGADQQPTQPATPPPTS